MTRRTATSIGFTAILLWSLLALFTAASGAVPPFQLSAMTFLIGGLVGVAGWIAGPLGLRALAQTPVVWVLGVGGLFGYHALYFASLRLAPPAEAGLVNYLWPLLIVLFSSFLPGVRPAVASRRRAPRLRRGRRPHRGGGAGRSIGPDMPARSRPPSCGPAIPSCRGASATCRPMRSRDLSRDGRPGSLVISPETTAGRWQRVARGPCARRRSGRRGLLRGTSE